MGFFLADGSCGYKKKPINRPNEYIFNRKSFSWHLENTDISLLKKSKDILEKQYGDIFSLVQTKTETSSKTYRLILNGGKKTRYIIDKYRKLFYYKKEKYIHPCILNNTREIREKIYQGYYAGDGLHYSNRTEQFDINSKITSQCLYFLCKSLGYEVSINHQIKKNKIYSFLVYKGKAQKNPNIIKKIIELPTTQQYVYDLETENHHFQAGVGEMIVHNTDGSHIKGLVLNWIHYYWPSLLNIGFNKSLATPILKAFKGKGKNKKTLKFYTQSDFNTWREKHKNEKGWSFKYYKGLGTHKDKEAIECFEDFDNDIIQYDYDQNKEESDYAINLAFNDDYYNKEKHQKWSDKRKEWLKQYNPDDIIEQKQKQIGISDFINKDLIHFSNEDTQRSIPSVMDGFKPSQRKIIYSAIKRSKSDKKEMRVAEFSGYVTFNSAYHHGDKSIVDATVGMSQTYVGSNNVNYLLPNGNFGGRLQGGSDHASSRYIHTNINPLTLDIFHINDELILDYIDDEGTKIEPKYYMPVIPTILLNGTKGIGTGFSTNIAPHRLEDICYAMKERMKGNPIPSIKPYFRGFQGRILEIESNNNTKKYATLGMFKIVPETNTIHIIELPIGMWTDKYTKIIERKITSQKKKYIISYENYCTKNTIHYILKLSHDGVKKYSKRSYESIIDDLKLMKTFSTSNMHLFDANGVIKKFNNTIQIMEYFYNHRRVFYVKRKDALIAQLNKIVEKLKAQVMFIRYYNQRKIIVRQKSKKELEDQLVKYKFPKYTNDNDGIKKYDYLTNMQIITLTNEKAQQLENKYKEMENQLQQLKNTTIEQMWSDDMNKIIKINQKYNQNIQQQFDDEKDNINKTRKTKSKKRKKKLRLDI